MSPSQKNDDGQEWERPFTLVEIAALPIETRHKILAWWDRSSTDHRDAQHLRERVRVLEEALREIDAEFDDGADPKTMRRLLDAALLSPAAATEGGEGA